MREDVAKWNAWRQHDPSGTGSLPCPTAPLRETLRSAGFCTWMRGEGTSAILETSVGTLT